MKALYWGLALTFVASIGEARVFNLTTEKFASYLLIHGSQSQIGKTFFEGESASAVEYSAGYNLLTSGEFGFFWASQYMNLRVGIEMIKPNVLAGIKAENTTDVLYNLDSSLTAYVPKIGVEFNMQSTGRSRSYAFITYGNASVTAENTYDITTAGAAAYPGVVDHTLEMKGTTSQMTYGLGYEAHFSDTTTYLFQMGYQAMSFGKLKASDAVTTISGSYAAGDTVTFSDGENRVLNFNSYFISLGLRLYVF